MWPGLLEPIEIIYFLIKMASEYNSIFESDIALNPCKNWRVAPREQYFEDSDRQNAA